MLRVISHLCVTTVDIAPSTPPEGLRHGEQGNPGVFVAPDGGLSREDAGQS